MWDRTDGCAKQYRCSIAYYLMSYLSKPYQIVLDRDVYTPGHGKDVVDGFNAVNKRYLATCLRMRSTPEKYKIDSNSMRVEAMTEKGEVSFSLLCHEFNTHTLTVNLVFFRSSTHSHTSG